MISFSVPRSCDKTVSFTKVPGTSPPSNLSCTSFRPTCGWFRQVSRDPQTSYTKPFENPNNQRHMQIHQTLVNDDARCLQWQENFEYEPSHTSSSSTFKIMSPLFSCWQLYAGPVRFCLSLSSHRQKEFVIGDRRCWRVKRGRKTFRGRYLTTNDHVVNDHTNQHNAHCGLGGEASRDRFCRNRKNVVAKGFFQESAQKLTISYDVFAFRTFLGR